ncbi:MAG: ribosomal protein S18-alanine N-acetyltransferase [Gemmatimonadota bacterium]|nr:ribosomal protein S18-alanine N-acetyltransferase [Gemmatimonadota bacterium]
MTAPVALRRAEPGDLQEISRIEVGSFRRPWRAETFASLLDRPDADVLVATLDGAVVGYAILTARSGDTELANLAVDPGHRRQGIASALLRGCMETLRDRDERWVLLAARASNEVAAGLYAAFGFREIGRHPDYYRDPPEDAVIFALEVGPANPPGGT